MIMLMNGKKGLIVGLANDKSIAYGRNSKINLSTRELDHSSK